MRGNGLLIALVILACVLSLLLYRAVVNTPVPKETHPIKEKARLIQKAPHQKEINKQKVQEENRRRGGWHRSRRTKNKVDQ
jgi:hypothetical protein